jgi:hypothetical protein
MYLKARPAGIMIVEGQRNPSVWARAKKVLLSRIAGKLVAGPSDNSMSAEMYRPTLFLHLTER